MPEGRRSDSHDARLLVSQNVPDRGADLLEEHIRVELGAALGCDVRRVGNLGGRSLYGAGHEVVQACSTRGRSDVQRKHGALLRRHAGVVRHCAANVAGTRAR